MTTRQPPILAGDLLNRRVTVIFTDPNADWQHFRLEAIDGVWLRLQGLPTPEGDAYDGGPIWVPASAVELLERAT